MSRKEARGTGDVVRCHCFYFQRGSAMIICDFSNNSWVISCLLYSIPKEGVGVSAPQGFLYFPLAVCWLLIHQAFGASTVTSSPLAVCFRGPFLCVVCSCDCCTHGAVHLLEKMQTDVCPFLLNYQVEMNGDLLPFCFTVRRRGGIQGSVRAV